MSAGFTPGPWDAIWWAAVLRDLHNFLPDELREGEGDPRYLYPGLSTFQSEQDAHLIAAAPSLYAELDEARRALKRIEQEPRTPTAMRDIAGARAHYAECALAKARGESAK